ncbi:hypothetical protein N9112_03310 [bacterium]|nr:hypothetical protein [bacterium]
MPLSFFETLQPLFLYLLLLLNLLSNILKPLQIITWHIKTRVTEVILLEGAKELDEFD